MREGRDTGLSSIVKTMACITAIPIATFGFYLAMHGHLTPGGGFAGGAVIATIMALLFVAFGKGVIRSLRVGGFSVRRTMLDDGIAVFGLIVLVSLLATFLHNPLTKSGWFPGAGIPYGPNPGNLLTGGIIQLMNLVVGLEVMVGLSLALALLVVLSKEGHRRQSEMTYDRKSGGRSG